MRLRIAPEIFALAPDVQIGVVRLSSIDNGGPSGTLGAQLAAEEQRLRTAPDRSNLLDDPGIAAWRAMYRAFGANPKRHCSSIEGLLRRVLADAPPRQVNPLVDLYNVVSLRHRLPVGGEDLAAVVGDIWLKRAGADEPAVYMLGEAEPHAPRPGEVVYQDDAGALCRRWNWKEAERTKLTVATRDAMIIVEALPPVDRARLGAALNEIAELAREHTRATAWTAILDAREPEIDLAAAP
jgi:DNA/RNA-binding domain of Phe-tRNA-synthetase-like protein